MTHSNYGIITDSGKNKLTSERISNFAHARYSSGIADTFPVWNAKNETSKRTDEFFSGKNCKFINIVGTR